MSDEPRFSRKRDAAIPLDLKTIVLKALAKDPAERYATAGELAVDLTLYLADQPIRARPPTRASRATKLARRHWKAVAAIGVTTVMMLSGVVAAALWSNSRLRAIDVQLENEIDRADRDAGSENSRRDVRAARTRRQLRLAARGTRRRPAGTGSADPARHPPQFRTRGARIVRLVPLEQGRRKNVVLFGPSPRSSAWHYLPTASGSPPATG